MKKFFLLRSYFAFILSFMCAGLNAQKLDTLYYDKDGIGISSPAFAAYYRVYAPHTLIGNKMRYRDFFINGKIRSEGEFVSIDKEDDKQSIFDGDCITYYESGQIKEKKHLVKGVLNGEYTSYYESGLVELHTFFNFGKKDGLDSYFDLSTRRCIQKTMQDNLPMYDYCIISDENGYVCKVRLSDKTVLWDSPNPSDIKKFWSNDSQWMYYQKNGVLIALNCKMVNDYGKWFQISVNVSNHTLVPFVFGCNNFSGVVRKKNGKEVPLNIYDANLFMNKVKNKQNSELIASSILQGIAAAGAGFSSSTSYTNTNYNGSSKSYGSVSAYGSGGYGYANYNANNSFSGHSSTVSTTVSYNGFAAYQAQVIASNQIASMEDAMWRERVQRYDGYLKRTTINPGETLGGYINIVREKGESLHLVVNLYGANYEFDWNL